MKKKLLYSLTIIVLIISCFTLQEKTIQASSLDKRAVWISYLDIDSLKNKSQQEFTANFITMCNTAKKHDINTLLVQVRPYSDALYPSKYFHWSNYISSDNASPGYDPLKIMISIAHANNLKLEAWINPYRISTSADQLTTFKKYSPIKNWLNTNKVIKKTGSDYTYILNPASSEVQDYIVKGINEIVENYNIDGIHLDDYFYVMGTLGDTTQTQRKTYVNQFVKKAYKKVKETNNKVTFGISPQGNVENCLNAGADVTTWLSSSGYVDYLMPQIYWSNQWGSNGQTKMFTNRINQWNALWKNKNIKMYTGLALYNTVNKPDGDIGWMKRNDNLKTQIESLTAIGWNGYSFFQYKNLLNTQAEIELENIANAPITLSSSTISMVQNGVSKVSAKTINSKLSWTSSNNRVASVDQMGTITAKKPGTATITVITSGGKKASCNVRVNAISLTLNKSSFSTYTGMKTKLYANVNNGSRITWKSSNSAVVSVDSTGTLSAKKAGKVTITSSATGIQKSIVVTVYNSSIKLNRNSATIYKGNTYGLKAYTTPRNAKVSWTTSNSKIASVNSKGVVTGKCAGKVTIRATINGKTTNCTFTIKNSYLNVNATRITFHRVRSYTVRATTTPKKKISWSSANSRIATVNSKGKISAKRKGKTYIYAKANGITKKIMIYVK